MQPDAGRLTRVAWREIFPWLLLFRTFRLAIDSRKLALATLAVALTAAGWSGLGWVFSAPREDDPHLAAGIDAYGDWPWNTSAAGGEHLADEGIAPWHMGAAAERDSDRLRRAWDGGADWRIDNPFLDPWRRLGDPFRQLFASRLSVPVGMAYYACAGLWALVVWSWFGGAIVRIAAVEMAREDRLSIKSSVRHVRAKWRAHVAAPLLPLVGVLIGVVLMLPLGLAMRLDAGLLLVGLLWPLALLGGLVMTIFLVGLVFGWPLMWAAIGVEGRDSWDALSRAYAYVYQRPIEYLFYAAISLLLGALGWLFVSFFASAVIYLALWSASWGSGADRLEEVRLAVPAEVPPLEWPIAAAGTVDGEAGFARQTGAALVAAWSALVRLVALGFAYSYFWTAVTAIYLLLRRDADGTPLDEVHFDEQEQTLDLPPLPSDAAGVAMAPEDAAAEGLSSSGTPDEQVRPDPAGGAGQ
jgi:hypothetical protein